MKKNLFFILMTFSLWEHAAMISLHAQPSIIDQIQKAEPAIVTIKTEASGLYKTPEVAAARDPQTGRIVAAQHLVKASVKRYAAGVIVAPSGIVVTNAHVVSNANHIHIILADHTETPAQIINVINNLDLALLKINFPQPLPFVSIADSDALELGQDVITVGNSQYLKQTISGGRIIGLGANRTEKGEGKKRTDLIQTTINLYRGDSGGPLFDKAGQLNGLMTAKESSSMRCSFAIPSNKIVKYLSGYLNETQAANSK